MGWDSSADNHAMATLRNVGFVVIPLLGVFIGLGWLFSEIVMYCVLSLGLTILLKPLVNVLNRLHIFAWQIPRALAIIFSFLVVAAIISIKIWLFLPIVSTQLNILISLDYQGLLHRITEPIYHIEQALINLNITNTEPGFLSKLMQDTLISFFKDIKLTSILNYFVGITGNLFMTILSVSFITFLLLYEERVLYRSFIACIPNRYFEMFTSWIFKVEKCFVAYLGGLAIQIGIIFSLITTGLYIAGVQYAPTIALFAVLANLIPYVGPLLGGTFAIIVGVSATDTILFSYINLILIIKIGIVFTMVQLVDNLFVQPLVFARSVRAHPIEIFLIIFVGATLAGVVGMVVAIPAYTILKLSIAKGYKDLSAYRIFKI